MFLLAAQRMSRGYARLRQWLILLFRMLAVAGLVLAVGRPLASGLLGLAAGGRVDTTIILLDCSPSMQQREAGAGLSKLAAGRRQLADTLATLGSSRWVLIDSTTNQPRELPSPGALRGRLLRGTDGRRSRPSRNARNRADLHSIQPYRADGDMDLLRPSRKRLARRQRPLADPPRELCGTGAGRPLPSAGVSRDGAGQHRGARHRRPPSAVRRSGRAAGLARPVAPKGKRTAR